MASLFQPIEGDLVYGKDMNLLLTPEATQELTALTKALEDLAEQRRKLERQKEAIWKNIKNYQNRET